MITQLVGPNHTPHTLTSSRRIYEGIKLVGAIPDFKG